VIPEYEGTKSSANGDSVTVEFMKSQLYMHCPAVHRATPSQHCWNDPEPATMQDIGQTC